MSALRGKSYREQLRRRAAQRSLDRYGRTELVEHSAPCGHSWKHSREDEPGLCPWCERRAVENQVRQREEGTPDA